MISVSFRRGLSHAIRSVVSDVSRHLSDRYVNRADSGRGIRNWRGGLRQFELRWLCWQNEKPNVQSDRSRDLRLRVQQQGAMQGIIVLAIGLLASPARGQELDAAWFKANYLPAAQKLDKAYSECSAKVSETGTNDKSDDYNKATFSFAFDGTRRKFDRTIESREKGSTNKWSRSIVASPEVSFMVLRKHEGEPLLERVNRSSMGFARATARIDEEAGDSIYAPFALLGERVSGWMKHKGFEINSVKQEGDRVRLDFHCNDREADRDYAGWISFLPNRQWVIDGWDITIKMTKPKEYSWRYATSVQYGDDVPVPAVTGMTMIGYHPDRTDTNKMVVDELSFAAASKSEFKLSNYGYDDRIGLPASSFRSLWFWLAAMGTACLLAAFAIRRIMSKRVTA